eukprot:CAMPEP_0173081620 /NCGR_PEP_ID=MMETSP1102-20130122/17403_1 /TAXON_ID=49646 /ORGANISM="Geminigera sp., Strain Caron Lab Isolate" /LENGTH=345 /DNA_ID=CAMNT_0013956279 /DNA_START=17 /DNA_END=1054 /DNA_ORIENTATION=+
MALRATASVAQGLREALSEPSAQDYDLAKVTEDRRMIKVADKTANGESADSFRSGVVRGLGSQREAVSDPETIDRSYLALLQKVSKLEAEKSDLQMQIQLDAVAYREVYKVAQELEEDLTAATAEIEKNQVEIAEFKVRGDQSYPAINSDLVSSSSPDAPSDSDCKPGESFLFVTVRAAKRTLCVVSASVSQAGKFLAKLQSPMMPPTLTASSHCNSAVGGMTLGMPDMTDMCVRQYAVAVAGPGHAEYHCPRRESCFGVPIVALTGSSRQSEPDPGKRSSCSLALRASSNDPKASDAWRHSETFSRSLPSQNARRQAEAHESRNFVHRRRETQRNETPPEDDAE